MAFQRHRGSPTKSSLYFRQSWTPFMSIELDLFGICHSGVVKCSLTFGEKTWPLGKEQRHGWVVIHHASASSPRGRIGQSNTLSLFVSYDCHLWEYPQQPPNWLQEALWRDARLSISKKTRRSVSPKSQDLFQSAVPEEVSVIKPPWILNGVKEKLEKTVAVQCLHLL